MATNAEATSINAKRLSELDRKEYRYKLSVSINKKVKQGVIDNFVKNLIIEEEVRLKVGAIIKKLSYLQQSIQIMHEQGILMVFWKLNLKNLMKNKQILRLIEFSSFNMVFH